MPEELTARTTAGGAPYRLPLLDRAYAACVRFALFPLMNAATGRSIHRKLRFLQHSQWWSRERLQALQLQKLRRLIEHAYENVPFYADTMRARGLHPRDFDSFEALRQLPVVTKAVLKQEPHAFLARGAAFERLVIGSTSGSTGQPTKFYRTREQDSWHWALKYRMWGMAGYRLGAPYVNVYNMARSGWRKRLQDRVLRNADFYIFSGQAQEEICAAIVPLLARPAVHYLAGCTSTIRILADYVARLADPPEFRLRALLSTGSLLTQAERAYIEGVLGAPMWDHYGLGGEGAHVAAECERRRGYHVNAENMIIEPAEPACVDTDEATRIYVTVLDSFDWPLIRYDSGDAAAFSTRACACGRGLPLLERIEGRVSDLLTLPNGTRVNVHFFSVLLGRHPDVQQYQVEQLASDRVRMRVVWRGVELAAAAKEEIRTALRRTGGADLSVEFEDVANIPLGSGGKHRYIIPLQAG